MKLKLGVISVLVLLGIPAYSNYFQHNHIVEKFELLNYVIELNKEELREITEGCDIVLNKLTIRVKDRTVFNEAICTADIRDVLFIKKGYLTVIEHYSSPVGWSKYYIIDLCQGRLIETKEIEEGTELIWDEFIKLSEETRKNYVSKILKL